MDKVYRSILAPLNLSAAAENGMTRNLERTSSGNDTTLYTPIGEAHDPKEILAKWDKIFNSKKDLLDPGLLGFEENNRSKYGPRSIAVPWDERSGSVYDSYKADECSKTLDIPRLGNRLRPLSEENALKYLKNTTSSGLPYLLKKGKVKPTLLQEQESLLKRKDPCALFTRTQENRKTRNVWCYPIADTLLEMQFYRPVLDYQKELPWRTAVTTPERVDAAVLQLMNHARAEDKFLVSIDFSAYDNTIKRTLIEHSFDYFRSLFQEGFHEQLDYIKERMITIGLVTPDGILSGDHGVPSGSTFTNEVDSVVQYLIASNYQNEILKYFQIQGDDGIYATNDPEKLFDHYKSFALNVNEDKSDRSKDYCLFLQKYYSYHYIDRGVVGGIYPTYRALNRLVYPERFVEFKEDLSGKDYFAIRTLSILENCKHHPLFREFVEFIMSLDKYSLIPSDQGLVGYVKFRTKQDGEDVNFSSHSYGNSTSIKSFASYQLIKSLS
uniref:RdRp n=1 Tax=Beihai picobirna-like virus 11 TaxID=1922516 RepID=A0A1L3KLB2_9VIRU|nr:RdRp [Beihai picobirna-like virus 11]